VELPEIQPKATKAMDMRFYWLKDREARKQFRIYCDVQTIRPTILTPWKVVEALRAKLNKIAESATSSAARVC
jgi:hypothetical protein